MWPPLRIDLLSIEIQFVPCRRQGNREIAEVEGAGAKDGHNEDMLKIASTDRHPGTNIKRSQMSWSVILIALTFDCPCTKL